MAKSTASLTVLYAFCVTVSVVLEGRVSSTHGLVGFFFVLGVILAISRLAVLSVVRHCSDARRMLEVLKC